MARRPATRSTVRKPRIPESPKSPKSRKSPEGPESPRGMVNGLKTTVISSDTVAELTKLCDESNFKTPKELDINVSIKPCLAGSCYVLACFAMFCYVLECFAMSWRVFLCLAMFFRFLSLFFVLSSQIKGCLP